MRIINGRAPKLSELLAAKRELEKLPPVCVRLFVSASLYEQMQEACEVHVGFELPDPMRELCERVSGVPVRVLPELEGSQWLAEFSDGTVKAYGFEVEDGRPISRERVMMGPTTGAHPRRHPRRR